MEEPILESMKKQIEAAFYILNFNPRNINFTLYKICVLYLKMSVYLIKRMSNDKVETKKHPADLTLNIIPLKIFKQLIKPIEVKCDKEKCILVSERVLEKLKVQNQVAESDDPKNNKQISSCNKRDIWVSIVIENELGVKFKRTVQVLSVEKVEDEVLISDENMFNIIQQTAKKSEDECQNQCLKYMTSKYKVISLQYVKDFIPQCISYVNLEYVDTFHNPLNNELIKNLLDNYFKYPRYHHLNDIIRINLKEYNLDIFTTEEVNYMSDMKFVHLKVCNFKTVVEMYLAKQNNGTKSGSMEKDDDRTPTQKNNSKRGDVQKTKTKEKSSYLENVKRLIPGLIRIIFKILDSDQHGFYISTVKGKIVIKCNVSSFIPNITKRSSLHLQGVEVSDYKKYILDSYNTCPYFEKLLKCVIVFHSGGRKHLLNFEMNQIFLLTGSHNAGMHDLTHAVAEISGVHIKQVNCISLIGSVPTILEKNLDNLFEKALKCAPCMLVFHNIEDICIDNAGNEDPRAMQYFIHCLSRLTSALSCTVVVCTSAKPDKIHHQIKRLFLKTIDVQPPKEPERHALIDYQLKLVAAEYRFDSDLVDYLAANSAGFERHDLLCLVRLSVKNKSASQDSSEKTLQKEDFKKVHAELQSRFSDRLDAPSVPNVSWEDIGGLSKLKEEILSTFRAVKRNSGLKRSGLLLHGPPGTGKTLIAKAVATECRMNFLAVKGPELLNKYIGQSEENIRNVFIRARSAAPCVVFFDELDSLAPRRGQEDQSSGVMDRVVSQLLAEMDGVHASKDVFILGATNRVDLLDPAILRPGRFDKSLCVGLYEDRTSQLGVLKAVVRKFKLSEDVQLDALVQHFPPQMSGADMYSICSDAWTCAVRRIIAKSPEVKDVPVMVNMEDFLAACPPAPQPETSPEITSSPKFIPEIEVA